MAITSCRFPLASGWVLAAVLALSVPGSAAADPLLDLQLELTELVEAREGSSAAQLAARVDAGLPPQALAAMLDAARAHPRDDLQPLVQRLATHRTPAIRARALVAWAALGPEQSVEAIEAAADDADAGVRRIAVVLGRLHPSDRAETVVAELLARDEALADELAVARLEAPVDAEAGS